MNGVLSLDTHHPEHLGFKEYYLGLTPGEYSPYYFINFWEDLFNCSTGIQPHGEEGEMDSYEYKHKPTTTQKCTGKVDS